MTKLTFRLRNCKKVTKNKESDFFNSAIVPSNLTVPMFKMNRTNAVVTQELQKNILKMDAEDSFRTMAYTRL